MLDLPLLINQAVVQLFLLLGSYFIPLFQNATLFLFISFLLDQLQLFHYGLDALVLQTLFGFNTIFFSLGFARVGGRKGGGLLLAVSDGLKVEDGRPNVLEVPL